MPASWTVLTAIALAAEPAAPADRVEEIPSTWQPEGLRRLAVTRAEASSCFAPESGQYRPDNAVDGNRGSKWVACVAPSREAPQWLTLHLVGVQELTAVALFGEAVNNNGVLDAEVQVAAAPGAEFRTAATVTDAKTRSWLVRFAPVQAAVVRLLVTRSDVAACPHTDVYEVELYGRPFEALAPAELKACAETLARTIAADLDAVEAAGAASDQAATENRQAVEDVLARTRPLLNQVQHWDTLDQPARVALVTDLERLAPGLRELPRVFEQAAVATEAHCGMAAALRQSAPALPAGQPVVSATTDDGRAWLRSGQVAVRLDAETGVWDAVWAEPVQAAVRGVRFRVSVNGHELALRQATTEAEPCQDTLGTGRQWHQVWGEDVVVERCLRVYADRPGVLVSGKITNRTERDLSLGHAVLIDVGKGQGGWWHVGSLLTAPAVVGYPGLTPPCRPAVRPGTAPANERTYASSGVLALAPPEPACGLTLGFATAAAGGPAVTAKFEPGSGGTGLRAALDLGGRALAPGESLALDGVWLAAHADPCAGLDEYGAVVAQAVPLPLRTRPNSLWCSWYPIRMGISEEIVFAIAEIAATHFRPLGLDLIQLDHGWQRADVCGDWVPNGRFPHGLKWLADQLRERYGLRLGLWIAPSVVAETTDLYREHPEWLFKGADGKPAALYRWYWKPNPQCYSLDCTHPEARKWVEQTFARLSADGVVYYKIDFPGGGPGRPTDPTCVPGWGVLQRMAEAIRAGAGPDAWVRYCQTSHLMAAGLGDSAYIGQDTGDAGLAWTSSYLDDNAQLLAATYWLNGRLYRREVCDMSVGLKADLEEARLRLAVMTLAGCSISFSDDFRLLDLPRIRLMQQCLPPGAPPMRPLDLFERRTPSLWHLPCHRAGDAWETLGLFNFEETPQELRVDFSRLGLPAAAKVAAFEFWEGKFLGVLETGLTLALAPHTSRILALRPAADRPQIVGTNMHLFQGWHEIEKTEWDTAAGRLSGVCRRAPGLSGRLYLHVPAGYQPQPDAVTPLTDLGNGVWALDLEFREAQVAWSVRFTRP